MYFSFIQCPIILELGISTYSFPYRVGLKIDPSKLLAKAKSLISFAASHRIHHLQFGDNLPLHLLSETAMIRLSETAERKKVKIQVGMRGLYFDRVLLYTEIANRLGSSFIRIVIDDEKFKPSEKEIIQVIRLLLPILKKKNIKLAIENHDRFPATVLRRIIEQTDKKYIAICLDTANSLGAGEGIEHVVEILAVYTINLHIKDYKIKRIADKMGFNIRGASAGEGQLDIPWLFQMMNKRAPCSTAILEVWPDAARSTRQALVEEKKSVTRSLAYLKNIIK